MLEIIKNISVIQLLFQFGFLLFYISKINNLFDTLITNKNQCDMWMSGNYIYRYYYPINYQLEFYSLYESALLVLAYFEDLSMFYCFYNPRIGKDQSTQVLPDNTHNISSGS